MNKLIRNSLLALAFITPGAVNAATIFAPTDGDVNFFNVSLQSTTMLAMFDDEDTAFANPLAIPLPSIVGIFGPIGVDFIATNSLSTTLTLTGSDYFILAISTDGGTNWSGDTSVTSAGANAYTVNFSDGSVFDVDVRVVPVPAAVWLFGSGLLGLVGVARRKARVA